VLKFGGTSVGTARALTSALEIAEAAAREGPVVIVVSALLLDAAALVRTDGAFAEAAVDYPATRRLAPAAVASLGRGVVPVVTGFLGSTEAAEPGIPLRVGNTLRPEGPGTWIGRWPAAEVSGELAPDEAEEPGTAA
jgi:aspartokinase